jgi:hypothetical protein
MEKHTVDDLISFLAAMDHYSREYALMLKALERVAKEHPEIFQRYENYVEELRGSQANRETFERSEAALDKLRLELLRE